MKIVSMTLKQAQWLGMAASVAGGCVCVSDEGREAAGVIGYDCIGVVPDSWRDYHRLSKAEIERVKLYLSVVCSRWSGAERINRERAQVMEQLGLTHSAQARKAI